MKDLRKELQTTKAQIGALKSSRPTKDWVLLQIASVPPPEPEQGGGQQAVERVVGKKGKKEKAPLMVKVKDPITGEYSVVEKEASLVK